MPGDWEREEGEQGLSGLLDAPEFESPGISPAERQPVWLLYRWACGTCHTRSNPGVTPGPIAPLGFWFFSQSQEEQLKGFRQEVTHRKLSDCLGKMDGRGRRANREMREAYTPPVRDDSSARSSEYLPIPWASSTFTCTCGGQFPEVCVCVGVV